ncbi:hypothetical protein M378DRAFT_154928 [Amanita muscaria Koide BX008]|uniref:Uncharacterized protein n=1 Tax=Amanita muscaria (strain Koide BX008) TaxID=946122 RepID=A0A0C2TVL7_AMAMK|nr:hypothetical protein M378DRAFT_154928 [Amanita muscaria Koide BX008]
MDAHLVFDCLWRFFDCLVCELDKLARHNALIHSLKMRTFLKVDSTSVHRLDADILES